MDVGVLKKYKDFMGSRFETISFAFDLLSTKERPVIVELGTSRSFVDGSRKGCMNSKKKYWNEHDVAGWDWGAGLFTRLCGEIIDHSQAHLFTVDPSKKAIEISKTITAACARNITFCNTTSTHFLSTIVPKTDFLYMDHHETCEEGALLHLRDSELIVSRQILTDNAVILIDDTGFDDDGKGKYSIPFLQKNGYKIVKKGYQTLMMK